MAQVVDDALDDSQDLHFKTAVELKNALMESLLRPRKSVARGLCGRARRGAECLAYTEDPATRILVFRSWLLPRFSL